MEKNLQQNLAGTNRLSMPRPGQRLTLLNHPRLIRLIVLCFAIYTLLEINGLLLGRCCIFQGIFGYPCPGCGLMQAGEALLHGDFAAAWISNACIFLWIPFLIYYAYALIKGREMEGRVMAALITVCLITFLYYFWRMQMYFPHEPVEYYHGCLIHRLGGFVQ